MCGMGAMSTGSGDRTSLRRCNHSTICADPNSMLLEHNLVPCECSLNSVYFMPIRSTLKGLARKVVSDQQELRAGVAWCPHVANADLSSRVPMQ